MSIYIYIDWGNNIKNNFKMIMGSDQIACALEHYSDLWNIDLNCPIWY